MSFNLLQQDHASASEDGNDSIDGELEGPKVETCHCAEGWTRKATAAA